MKSIEKWIRKGVFYICIFMAMFGLVNIIVNFSRILLKLLLTVFPICWIAGAIIFWQLKKNYEVNFIKKHTPDKDKAKSLKLYRIQSVCFFVFGSFVTGLCVLLWTMAMIRIE